MLASGRRGVFNGVKEGIHQHWKHREVVKVITMQKLFGQVMYTAKFLEAESGGVLVSVDKLKKGHAIIIYRGKNYQRPFKPICGNLLSKRKALHRSLEMQRIGVRSCFLVVVLFLELCIVYICSQFEPCSFSLSRSSFLHPTDSRQP